MRKIVFFSFLLFSCSGYAGCPLADHLFEQGNQSGAVNALKNCAIYYNDDESQFKLAQAYAKGNYGLKKDTNQSLYFYHLSAENGNAQAQVNLAEAIIIADQNYNSRIKLLEHYVNIVVSTYSSSNGEHTTDMIHPYALLKLAAESPDKKWYYPSLERAAPTRTLSLLQKYEFTEDMKKLAMRQASEFKARKLLQVAKEVLPADEYPQMEKRLKSPQTQKQAMEELKIKMEEYIQRKKDVRKTK